MSAAPSRLEDAGALDALADRLAAASAKKLLTRDEAAFRLSMSLTTFERLVQPDLLLVRTSSGSRARPLVPVSELDRWIDENKQMEGTG